MSASSALTSIPVRLRSLLRSAFARNVGILLTGTAFSQVLLLLAAPFLSRLYDPAAFGVFGVYMATVGLIRPLIHLRYGQAIVLPKEDQDAGALLVLAVGIALTISAASVLVIAVAGGFVAELLGLGGNAGWLWWIPLSLILAGLTEILESWATRRKRFWRIANRQMGRSVAQLTVQLFGGFRGWGPAGLVAGVLSGQAAETASLGSQFLKQDRSVVRRGFSRARVRKAARDYRSFALYGAPSDVFNAASQSIPTLLISYFFGMAVVGLYSMGVRVLLMPANLMTMSLRQVFYQKAAEVHNSGGDLRALFKRATSYLTALVAAPTVLVFFLGPWIFGIVLGSEWTEAGVYARWLVLWVACLVVNVPASAILRVLKMQKFSLIFDVGLTASRTLAILIPGMFFSARTAIASFAIVGLIANVIFIYLTDQILGGRWARPVAAAAGPGTDLMSQ